jgi:tetratricopeptide (TPR) repeat protein
MECAVRRVIVLGAIFFLLTTVLLSPRVSSADTVASLLGRARSANAQVRGLKRGSVSDKQRAIQTLGPVVLELVGASDLASAAQTQRGTVRDLCDTLNDPLEDIHNDAMGDINRMSKAVMDQDGDLEALYETQPWKDAQLVGSQSLYFLNWLRYICSFVADRGQRKDMLQKAADGFSEFAVGKQGSQLKRESLFGRALAEKELRQYDWAIRDFELILQDSGVPDDMERKVRLSLADAKARKARYGNQKDDEEDKTPAQPTAEDIAQAYLDKAKSLFDRRRKERGDAREKTLFEALAYAEEAKKKSDKIQKVADALIKNELTPEEAAMVEEERNPFPQWKEASELLRAQNYSAAVPLLEEVVASNDPRAKSHRREALYFLGAGLFQQGAYRKSIARLDDFFGNDGVPERYGDEAAYLQFKAAEKIYSSPPQPPSAETIKLYLDTTKDFIRRYPKHKSLYEAYYRLGEYEQSTKDYLAAVNYYQKVTGDLPFRLRADYSTLQSYSALQEALDEKKPVNISEKDLRSRTGAALQSFWKNLAALDKNPAQVQALGKELKDWRGRATFMNAVYLGKDMDANAAELLTLLQDFEKKYPEQKDAFESVARTRLIVLQKTGRYAELEKETDRIMATYKGEQQQELLKGLNQVLASDIKRLDNGGDKDKENLLIARRTLARLQAERLKRGDTFGPEESPEQFKYDLAQLYLDIKDYDKAAQIYQELRTGKFSLAALIGLAQIAEVKGDTNQSFALWGDVMKEAKPGDIAWFRGTYGVAQLQGKQGNKDQACKTISEAFVRIAQLPDLSLRKRIQDLAVQTCKK